MDVEVPASSAETLLVVDDEEMLVELLRRLLARNGFTALSAMSASEALEKFEAHRNEIGLVITDLMMPGMDGKALAAELLRRDPNVKILISTGFTSPADIDDLLASGARDVVMKPYQADKLLEKIRETLRGDQPDEGE
jgi:two-component system cell cycle sensor histidine kinase/response regulator CckA